MKRMKKTLCILLSLLMVLAMIPGTALANTTGLTLHGGGNAAFPSKTGTVGNGIFTETMTVEWNGEKISNYSVKIKNEYAEMGTVEKNEIDGTFYFIPKKAGLCPIIICYGEESTEEYQFNFNVYENDLPSTRYFYNMNDTETMLLGNGRGIGNTIAGEKRYGPNCPEEEFAITSIVSSNPNVIKVTPRTNGNGYDINAVAVGEATITITHNGFDGQVEKEITVNVVREKWFCKISAEDDCTQLLPGTSTTLTVTPWLSVYNSEEEYIEENYDISYAAEWSLENSSQADRITLSPVENGKTVTVSAKSGMADLNVPVRVEIYSLDENGIKSAKPVISTSCEIRVRQEFYTIELPNFNPNLQKGQSMSLTPSLKRHYMNDGVEVIADVDAAAVAFECTGCNNLNININEANGIFTITRPSGGNADFRLEARYNGNRVERKFYLNWISNQLNTYTVFSKEPVTGNDYSKILKTFKLQFENGSTAPVSETLYVYTATYNKGQITGLSPVLGGLEMFYCLENTDQGPEYDKNTTGLTISKTGGDDSCQYTFKIDPSAYNNFQNGLGKYDLYPNGIDSYYAEMTVQRIMPPSREESYGICLEMLQNPADYGKDDDWMWVNGQGNSMPFTNKISSWDTCFYVENLRTSLDARFIPEDGKDETRTYIGKSGEFVIEVQERNAGNDTWVLQDNLTDDAYKVYAISYIGIKKNFEPVFNVRYTKEANAVQVATEKYRYRLRYTGEDRYLDNKNSENRFCIELEFDNNLKEFDIDEYFMYTGGQWSIGNRHYFNSVGTELLMQKIIRPGDLKSVEDKKIYGEKDYIYIENEAENIGFYRAEYGPEGKRLEKLENNESPFSIIWNASEGHYVVTYDNPANDIYGPEYYMIYDGDYDAKINNKYGYTEGTTHNVGNISRLITGKLTVRATEEDIQNGMIDASTENENINATEVIFGIDVLNNLNKELKIKTKHGEISFEGDIVDNLKKTQSNDASFEMRDVMTDGYGLTNEQKNALHNCDVAFDFDITSGEAKVEFGETGTAAIVIPFEDTSKAVYYLDENGKMYPVEYVFDQGHVKFIAKHFSTYVVADKGLGEDPEPTPSIPGGLPATSTDKVTQSGDTTTADLSGSTTSKGGETTTTVDQTTADKMVETAVKNNSEEIVINAVTKNESAASSAKAAEVVLTGETLQTIAEKTDADVVIQTNVAEVKLDNKTAEAVASQTGEGETVSIITEKVKEEAKEVQFELKIVTSSGKVISDFDGGNVAVTVNVPKSLSNKKVVCVYIDEKGYMHKVEGTLNADGTYTFTTGHFSTYALMDEGEAEAAIEAQKEAVKALKPTLRSSQVKTKSGKKAIKLTWKGGEDIQLEGIEIYRSLKKSSGYGKKPFYTTTKTSYTNTSVKAGKKYYYKVRGFVTIDGEKVYTQYSTKAWRTVK